MKTVMGTYLFPRRLEPEPWFQSYRGTEINFHVFSLNGWDGKLLLLTISILKGSGNCVVQHSKREALTKAPRQLVTINFLRYWQR